MLRHKLLALLLGCAMALVALEVAVRLVGLRPPSLASEDERAHVERLANWSKRSRNAEGYFDVEWAIEKPPGTWRVFFLGDSFTESLSVELEATFVRRIEQSLNASAPEGRRFELFSVARRAWSTVQEYEALVELLPYRPDAVVVVYFINDATGMGSNPPLAKRLGTHAYTRDGLLNRVSALYDYLDYRWRRRVVTRETFRDYHESFRGSALAQARWTASKRHLEKLRALADEHAIELGLIVFPVLVELEATHSLTGLYDMVEAHSAKIGIPSMSLLPAFEGQDPESLWVSPVDAHPNAAAHEIVIEPIETFLYQVGLVPSHGAPGQQTE